MKRVGDEEEKASSSGYLFIKMMRGGYVRGLMTTKNKCSVLSPKARSVLKELILKIWVEMHRS